MKRRILQNINHNINKRYNAMNKTYQIPKIKVAPVQSEQMMAGSINVPMNGQDATGAGLARQGYWDGEYADE